MTWEGCDGCTEQDEVMYMNGYVKGYNSAISELSKEISDEEIKKGIYQNVVDIGKIKLVLEIDAMIKGAKWYREQLKSKQ